MNHAIVIVTQITQERRHGRGLRPGVMKQDDSPPTSAAVNSVSNFPTRI
jgi:hypothetical protein